MRAAWDLVVARLWKDILSTIEALIVPPLSERQTEMKPLSEKELDIVFKWLGVRSFRFSIFWYSFSARISFWSTSSIRRATACLSRSCAMQNIEVSRSLSRDGSCFDDGLRRFGRGSLVLRLVERSVDGRGCPS